MEKEQELITELIEFVWQSYRGVACSHLDLSSNGISSLPVCSLPALRTLQLEHNQLQALPDSWAGFGALVRLDVSHNDLAELPASLARLPALQRLIASNNRLLEVPVDLGLMRTLKELDIRCTMSPETSRHDEISKLMLKK